MRACVRASVCPFLLVPAYVCVACLPACLPACLCLRGVRACLSVRRACLCVCEACLPACLHAYIWVCVPAYVRLCVLGACVRLFVRACLPTCICLCVPACVCLCVLAWVCACVCACVLYLHLCLVGLLCLESEALPRPDSGSPFCWAGAFLMTVTSNDSTPIRGFDTCTHRHARTDTHAHIQLVCLI